MHILYVSALYIFCHALTQLVIFPLQSATLGADMSYGSLLYLPHGVRVLATWAFGWRAIPGLIIGNYLSALLFNPDSMAALISPIILEGVFLGSISAFLVFEACRLLGHNLYMVGTVRLDWKAMLMIGAAASILNSIGQTLAYSKVLPWESLVKQPLIFLTGDIMGVVVCMVALMFMFRVLRRFGL